MTTTPDQQPDPAGLDIFNRLDVAQAPVAHRLAGAPTPAPIPATSTVLPPAQDLAVLPLGVVPVPAGVPAAGFAPVATEKVSIDWTQIATLRAKVAAQLAERLDGEDRSTPRGRELGRAIIQDVLSEESQARVVMGEQAYGPATHDAMARALFQSVFELGRIQTLVDNPDVETIQIFGCNNVRLDMADGSEQVVDPVAESNDQLVADLQFIADNSAATRMFSPNHPTMHLRLPGGERLAAAAWVTAYPTISIRRHRLRTLTLNDLVEKNLLSPLMAKFLDAAVKAGKTIMVSGDQKAGKTTLLRALCRAIPDYENIGTFETEYELLLHEYAQYFPRVVPFEARPGTGEIGADGKDAGVFTLGQALEDSFRFGLDRYIVGEIRGPEAWTLIKAVESGEGAFGTTHAKNAVLTIDKLVTCAAEAPNVSMDQARAKLLQAIDLVVHIRVDRVPRPGAHNVWDKYRYVDEIVAIKPGETALTLSHEHVFSPSGVPAMPAVANVLPDDLALQLEPFGFSRQEFVAQKMMGV